MDQDLYYCVPRKRKSAKSIVSRAQEESKRSKRQESGSNDIENGNIVDGSIDDTIEDDVVSPLLPDRNYTYANTGNDSIKSDERWSALTENDLDKMDFLLHSTQSKTAINAYFSAHDISNEHVMRSILFEKDYFHKVQGCDNCKQFIEQCVCSKRSKKNFEIYFGDPNNSLKRIAQCIGEEVLNTQKRIMDSNVPSSSPMGSRKLKIHLEDSVNKSEATIHFQSSFDGISLHQRGRMKCWPYSVKVLDLEDVHRSRSSSLILCAICFGHKDPSFEVHDLIFEWCIQELRKPIKFGGRRWTGEIVSAVFDDPAKRKVYNLAGWSSKGACAWCLNQGTRIKMNSRETMCRIHMTFALPDHIHDGMNKRGQHSKLNQYLPMQESVIDFFHLMLEGLMSKMITNSMSSSKFREFKKFLITFGPPPRLPSHCKTISDRISNISGQEKLMIFESVLVPAAMCMQMSPLAAVVVLSIHGIYRLNVDPLSVEDKTIHKKAEKICSSLLPLIQKIQPDLLGGPKWHQFFFHLPKSMENFGPLVTVSTMHFEHHYHDIQQTLCPEIVNGVGFTMLQNSSTIQGLRAEVSRRIQTDTKFSKTWAGLKLSEKFGFVSKSHHFVPFPIPLEFRTNARNSDKYFKTVWIEGRRYGHFRFGRCRGFLSPNGQSEIRVLMEPLAFRNDFFDTISRQLRRQNNISGAILSRLTNAISDHKFGGVLRKHFVGAIVVVESTEIHGHAAIIERNGFDVIIPLATRPMLS